MANRELGAVVNWNPKYANFQFDWFTLQTFLTLFPFIYIIPTFFIIFRIIQIFFINFTQYKHPSVNRNVFLVLVLSLISSICFFFFDLFVFRIPSTGYMTSWCYHQEPNSFLNILFNISGYFNYSAMLYPVLFSIIRLIIAIFPSRHEEVNSKLLKFALPFIFVYPFPFLSFMIPAIGVCREHISPYQFGAVYIHFINSWNNLGHALFLIINSVFWISICLVLNWILYRKLRKLRSISLSSSVKNKKLEVSLSLTTFSMFFAYAINLIFLGSFTIDYDVASYLIRVRPFGYDLEMCVVPWVFYSTHPVFKKKTIENRAAVSTTRKPISL